MAHSTADGSAVGRFVAHWVWTLCLLPDGCWFESQGLQSDVTIVPGSLVYNCPGSVWCYMLIWIKESDKFKMRGIWDPVFPDGTLVWSWWFVLYLYY